MRVLAFLLLLLLVATPAFAQQAGEPGKFDYYVLALSWSPSWCDDKGHRDAEQCRAGGHGFIVHGLWPQYARGGYPANCARPAPVPEASVAEMLPLMPSASLIRKQWTKHGTCQGLDPKLYFAETRKAAARVTIPEPFTRRGQAQSMAVDEVEKLFAAANPGLSPQSIAVVCKGKQVAELRVCLDRSLGFRPCGEDVRDRCRGAVTFPAIP